MPYKNGIVVNVMGNGWAEVVTDQLDACTDCVSAHNCPEDCKNARTVTKVRDEINAEIGDTVSVYISRKSMLKSAAILYLVPVAFLLIGVGTGIESGPTPRFGDFLGGYTLRAGRTLFRLFPDQSTFRTPVDGEQLFSQNRPYLVQGVRCSVGPIGSDKPQRQEP